MFLNKFETISFISGYIFYIFLIEVYDVSLRAGSGKGFREPGFDEKILNFDLKLEQVKNKEIGLRRSGFL